jgi:hypothetical protein
MTSKFTRFLHLERSRGERSKPEEPPRLQSGGRFEALAERGAAPQGAVVPEAHLERFRGEAPLALAEAPNKEERFPRCARCESENGRYTRECGVCGADLNTPQQREYNERLWQTREAQEREHAQALEQAQQQVEAQRQEDAAAKARLHEQLRLQPWDIHRGNSFLKGRSPGMALLSLIPSKPVRWGVGLALALLPFLVVRYGPLGARRTAMVVGLILLVSFIPPSWAKPTRRF